MNLTQENINLIEREGKHTYEVHTNEGLVKLPSITTIINYVVNKPALPPWSFGIGVKSTRQYLNEWVKGHELDEEDELPSDGEIKLALDERGATQNDEMKRGAERGTAVHSYLEAIIKGDKDFTYKKKYKPYIETIDKFIEDYEPEWHHSEFKVASLEHGFAGTFDAICTMHKHPPRRRHVSLVDKRCLIDVKSNSEGRVYPETHIPQVEGYCKAFYEMDGNGIDHNVVLGIGPDGKFSPCVSYGRFNTFKVILDAYNEFQWLKGNNPNKRK